MKFGNYYELIIPENRDLYWAKKKLCVGDNDL